MNQQCPKIGTCNLFEGKLEIPEDSVIRYKCFYCLCENTRWSNCKRFMVFDEIGFCPDFVMPNSLLSSEQIMSRIRWPKSISLSI
jgi:hypothetical protein